MIQEFVDKFMESKSVLENIFSNKHPDNYEEIVRHVIEILEYSTGYDKICSKKIHCIDDGDYQGTLLFVIGSDAYQTSTYWYVKVGYGSCSGCDTLQAIRTYEDDKPSKEQIEGYMTLALHIVQGLKEME